jgi:hypothetical protein
MVERVSKLRGVRDAMRCYHLLPGAICCNTPSKVKSSDRTRSENPVVLCGNPIHSRVRSLISYHSGHSPSVRLGAYDLMR